MIQKLIFKLNEQQQKATNHRAGPLLVVAGAGTGKTRVIVERIISLINEGVNPSSILALTFTEKAAAEMLDRLNDQRGGITLDTTISTYNSFGDEILRSFAVDIGLGDLRLLGETGQLVFMRQHLDELKLDYYAPIARPDSQLSAIRDYISLLKQQLVKPADYVDYVRKMPAQSEEEKIEKQKHLELAHIFKAYITLCRKNNVIDYDDQLYLTIELLNKRPNIRKQLQEQYRFILVDEFQDTNPMQSALLDLLAGDGQNIMVVGDDDQSIYGWRGATLANILEFKKRYPKAQEVTLIENYRSTQIILDSAYRLIQHNNPNRLEVINKLNKHLHAQRNGDKNVALRRFSDIKTEIDWVTKDIKHRLEMGEDPASIAVLARRNQDVQRMHENLEIHSVPHAVAGISNDLYEQVSINQLIEGLKAVSDPLDDLALFHTLGGPLFNGSAQELANYAALSRREHLPLHQVIDGQDHGVLKTALQKIDSWREKSQQLTVGELAYTIITESGWKQHLYSQAEHDAKINAQVQAISLFFKTLKEFEYIAGVASVQNYIQNLPTLRAAGNEFHDATLDISDTMLNVLSIHRAKGLEWDTVYVIDCVEGSLPMRAYGSTLKFPPGLIKESAADDHMAEERRLMYVAMTRAKNELIITYSDTAEIGTIRKPSRFLSELLGHELDEKIVDGQTQISMELFAPMQPETFLPLPVNMTQNDKIILTVSQIDCWLRCPQDFYYLHVQQTPQPVDPSKHYGTLIHDCIQLLHTSMTNNETLSLNKLLSILDERLPKDGYLTIRSRERAHQQAVATIRQLYDRFTTQTQPELFEHAFKVEIPDTPLVMTGRIDAVFRTSKGVEIVDYKTGTTIDSNVKAKQRANASTQLSLYALAWRLLHSEMPYMLTLDFVETNQQGSVRKQPKTLDNLLAKLQLIAPSLESRSYPNGKDHKYCKHPII